MEDFLTAFCPKLPEFGLNSPKLGRNGGQTSAYIPKMGACRKSGRNTNPIPGSNPQLSGRLGHHADPPPLESPNGPPWGPRSPNHVSTNPEGLPIHPSLSPRPCGHRVRQGRGTDEAVRTKQNLSLEGDLRQKVARLQPPDMVGCFLTPFQAAIQPLPLRSTNRGRTPWAKQGSLPPSAMVG